MSNQTSTTPINLITEKGWSSWDDIENEIERIREEFNLLESTSRYDDAYSMFETIYCVNALDLRAYVK
jgi:hypothetical protein